MAPLLSANEEEIPFDINEDEILAKPLDDAKPSKLKKAAAAFAAFLLFFLIVSYSVAFLGMDSIPGLIKSRQMDVTAYRLEIQCLYSLKVFMMRLYLMQMRTKVLRQNSA